MANPHTPRIKAAIEQQCGSLQRRGNGLSLFYAPALDAVIYFRYSKIHDGNPPYCFFGLRHDDVRLMQGGRAFLCFVTDREEQFYLVPFAKFEHCFNSSTITRDSHYKVMIFFEKTATAIYFPKNGKFNADSYLGLSGLNPLLKRQAVPASFSHTEAQSLIGEIGIAKGFDIWIPRNDSAAIDAARVPTARRRESLPSLGANVDNILAEIDVIWLDDSRFISVFEVEHTTPIYSGLLRLCDAMLSTSTIDDFKIVSADERESAFERQINRPTFRRFKLGEKVMFLSYENLFYWHQNIADMRKSQS